MFFRLTKILFRFLLFLLIISTVLVVSLFIRKEAKEISNSKPQKAQEAKNYFPIEEDVSEVKKESTPSELEKAEKFPSLDCENPQENEIASSMLELINKDRKAAGKEELSWNSKLCQSALSKSQDMIENNYFTHVSPDLVTPWFWIEKVGYDFSVSGENLALNYFEGQSAHEAFMESEGHRENVLNESFTEIGINYAFGQINNQPAFVLVEHFASPAIENPEPKIVCDEETAEENLEKLSEQLDLIEEYEDEAEEAREKMKKADADTKEVDEYLDYLDEKQEELEDLVKENKDYLKKCKEVEES